MAVGALEKFVEYTKHLRGDEKGEAQVFLEHLFQAFGHASLAESGAVLEERVRSSGTKGKSKGVKFADLVWKPRVLIEMKKRGERLDRHYLQAFDYWRELVPRRPRWIVLCNFDEFWVYDFDLQVDEPMDRLRIDELPARAASLAFLKPIEETPLFGVNRIDVTRAAADKVALVFNSMVKRGVDRIRAQRFLLQCVISKFSEDLDLLPKDFFTRILRESLQAKNPSATAFDDLTTLFRQMNTQKPAQGGRFKDIRYFNGGLFAQVDVVELTVPELQDLSDAAGENWKKVNPGIFGTLFQHSMDQDARHAYGAHYTSEADILKVVIPTIVRPWRDLTEKTDTLEGLLALRQRLYEFKVLDPACGSGNFLYVAFREMKRLETDIILKIRKEFPGRRGQSVTRGFLSPRQFYGFDTLDFAVELAKVTLLFAKELGLQEAAEAIRDETGETWVDLDAALPLDNLDQNVQRADALFTQWPAVDAIIGNPPFQSKNKMQEEMGRPYLNRLRKVMPGVPGRADFCVYFFRKAHDHLKPGMRAGLVGTNTIRQNDSRVGGLDYICAKGGTITEAVSTQLWSGEAVVHVSIVNWVRGSSPGKKRLMHQKEDLTWTVTEMDEINPALSAGVDTTKSTRLQANANGLFCAQGQTHGHEGFLLPADEAKELLRKTPAYAQVIHPFLIGDDLLGSKDPAPSRYVIDFRGLDLFGAKRYGPLVDIIERKVLPDRKASAAKETLRTKDAKADDAKAKVTSHHANFLKRWWQLSYARGELMQFLESLPRYIVCVRVTRRPIFAFVSAKIHPNDSLMVFPFADDYAFGVFQSTHHWTWFTDRCSSMKADPRYTSDSVFDTFVWPQSPTAAQIEAVARAAVRLRTVRRDVMGRNKIGLRELYRIAELPGSNPLRDAQIELDQAVTKAYGMPAKADMLTFLRDLNTTMGKQEANGKAVTGPGCPDQRLAKRLITADVSC